MVQSIMPLRAHRTKVLWWPAGADQRAHSFKSLVTLRDRLGLGFPDRIEEGLGYARGSDLPQERGPCADLLAVNSASGIDVLTDRRSIQRDPRKSTFGA